MKYIITTICVSMFVAACGGGGGGGAITNPSTPATPAAATTPVKPAIKAAANFTVNGVIGPGSNVSSARITTYDSLGKVCGSPVFSDGKGQFSINAKCTFPILLFADLPDGNDAGVMPEGSVGEGRKYFNFVSEITNDGQSFTANLTPATAATTMLVMARIPSPGQANPSSILNETRRALANAKIQEGLTPFATALGLSINDYFTVDASTNSQMASLFSVIQISFERIESTKQSLIKFNSPSEHRSLVLVATDTKPLESAYFDSGLGVLPSEISPSDASAAAAASGEIKTFLNGVSPSSVTAFDSCFLHNSSKSPLALFDVPIGWTPKFSSSFENITLNRLNTYTDFTNETLEQRNLGTGTLAFISFDFRNKHGLKQRAYTWLIKGSQKIGECDSSGSGWRVLGNQRNVYVKTDTIAVHESTVSQQFGSRKDTYGTGTEHFVYDTNPTPFTHVLINGPGFPTDGNVFIRSSGGEFLSSTMSLLTMRSAILKADGNEKLIEQAKGKIYESMSDTMAVMLTDTSVKQITDSYFDNQQNVFTYRFFSKFEDLSPSLTIKDVIPKRPYLATELPIDYFPSVSINIDDLVQALQVSDPVQVNWSLPLDLRSNKVLPERAFITRKNCIDPSKWPGCSNRKDQLNSYGLAMTYFDVASTSSAILTPEPLASANLKTFMGYMRVRLLDSLNRPIETRVGMTYQR